MFVMRLVVLVGYTYFRFVFSVSGVYGDKVFSIFFVGNKGFVFSFRGLRDRRL